MCMCMRHTQEVWGMAMMILEVTFQKPLFFYYFCN